MREIQQEVDKHPIKVPIDAEVSPVVAQSVTNYNGPIVVNAGGSAQIAFGTGSLQERSDIESVSPGYEELAATLADLIARVDDFMSESDARALREGAESVLREVSEQQPEATKVGSLVTTVKGLLASLALGLAQGAGVGGVEWARDLVERLTQAAPSG